MLDKDKVQQIITCLILADKSELIDYLEKLIKKGYPEMIPSSEEDDDELSWCSGSSASEEHFGYHKDDDGLMSLK